MQDVPENEKIIIAGDLTEHVGKERQGGESVNRDQILENGMKQGKGFWSILERKIGSTLSTCKAIKIIENKTCNNYSKIFLLRLLNKIVLLKQYISVLGIAIYYSYLFIYTLNSIM